MTDILTAPGARSYRRLPGVRYVGRFVLGALVAVCVMSVSACAPRGETSSVDEVLASARQRFEQSKLAMTESAASPKVLSAVQGAATALENLLGSSAPQQQASMARSVEQELSSLLPHAGYTSRPSLTEVKKQFRELAEDLSHASGAQPAAGGRDLAVLKTAATRAYTVLAGELETTGFAL